MPRFYIDTDDGASFCADVEGAIYSDLDQAKAEALAALPEMLHGRPHLTDCQKISATIRDESGTVLLTAQMRLAVEVVRRAARV